MRRRATSALAVALLLNGCSLLPGLGPSTGPSGPTPLSSSSAPASDDVVAMTAAYDAFAKELGLAGKVLGVSYSASKSIAYTGLTTQSLVFENGALSKTWDRMPGSTTDKSMALTMATPAALMKSLSAKGACTRARQVGVHVYWGGWRLVDAQCTDDRGARIVQVTEAGEEFKTVDMTTKEGFNQLWADMLSYGPETMPIHRYEYLFTAADGRAPGVYVKNNTLVQYRVAQPGKTPAFNETVEKADPAGASTVFVKSNGTSFWNAYQVAKSKCGTVDKLAVAWQGTTPIIVGSNASCSASTDATGKPI